VRVSGDWVVDVALMRCFYRNTFTCLVDRWCSVDLISPSGPLCILISRYVLVAAASRGLSLAS